jgi:aminoglycoside phosphotransferase family enzyme/predicted kinase
MDVPRLIEALSRSSAYAGAVDAVEVHQTHISVVFLAGSLAYKIKKPVRLGFVDYGHVERRRHFCEEEVRLNRRLAPEVYLGVVPVTREGEAIRVEGAGEVLEWAVKMRRLPESATLRARLYGDGVTADAVAELARRLARFHATADSSPDVAACCTFEAIATNTRENLDQSAPQVGVTLSRSTHDRLRDRFEVTLERLRCLIEARAASGIPRDTHGDLRLDHVYWFPDRQPPGDWVVVDCIEFDARYRHADPIADIAFLAMELGLEGRSDLAGVFVAAYLRAAGDSEGGQLLPLYRAYRAAVRGKVEGMKLAEPEIPEADRSAARSRARALWLYALSELEEPGRRPCLVLLAGLPGTGKSTLARGLAERADFTVIRSDLVRKELAGRGDGPSATSAFGGDIYTPEWDERTYAECLRRADGVVFKAGRVLIDASFREESRRQSFLDAARRWGIAARLLLCQADPEVVRRRLDRRLDDPSDAGWAIYQEAARRWEEPGAATRAVTDQIDADGKPAQTLERAVAALRGAGLQDEVQQDPPHPETSEARR